MIDFRRLFDKYRIEWRDRGANVAKGNINISCIICNRSTNPDKGFHLAIFETTGQFYCFRNPKHNGHNASYILRLLKIPPNEYRDIDFKEVVRTEKNADKDFSLIRHFQPASENQEAVEYLRERFFTQPEEAARKFKLLVDADGKWSGRLIIPLTIGWTGRSMRSHIEPRYLTHGTEDSYFTYKQGSTTCIILEGSIDCMRIASVSSQFDVRGKCGNRLSAALLNDLRESKYITILNCPDGDVDFGQYYEETKLLRSYCSYSDVKRFKMPETFKDFGLMSEGEARRWLMRSSQM